MDCTNCGTHIKPGGEYEHREHVFCGQWCSEQWQNNTAAALKEAAKITKLETKEEGPCH